MFDGLMGAEVVRQRRIGAGSSVVFRSVIILSIGGKAIVDALLDRIRFCRGLFVTGSMFKR
jgi:hypothetical protein